MQNLVKDFLYFTQKEKRGIVVLMGIIVAAVLGTYAFGLYRQNRESSAEEKLKQQLALKETEGFMTSITNVARKPKKWNHSGKRPPQPRPIVLRPFDPNSADSVTLCQLGLPAWMAQNILRYRAKGGKFRKVDDFGKIYGLTKEQYATLLPYLRITAEDAAHTPRQLFLTEAKTDTTASPPFKYPAGTVVELNEADTTELKKIPGIGSGIARLIVNYRGQLGGFYSIEQLREIKLDAGRLKTWFSVDAQRIRRINVNRTGVEQLRRHPYINFYQAKALVEYRQKEGALNSLKPFALYEEFSEADFKRIGHYICF